MGQETDLPKLRRAVLRPQKKNIECPQCGAPFSLAPPAKPKRPAPLAEKPGPENTNPVEAAADNVVSAAGADDDAPDIGDAEDEDEDKDGGEDEDEAGADEKDDKLIEDASDLGEDDDDMSEVKEHIDDGVEDKN
jgi:hypothetical protein|tara:strand:+ start:1135 stop:1539 length:405 start_codon:yes stop_codon:yes gene_type:complete